jgi:hypothetical protein
MNNAEMMAALQMLPDADLMTASKMTDPLGAGTYYRADTVVRLHFPLRKAAEEALAVLEALDEAEMARLRGRADTAIKSLRKALKKA